MNVPDFRALTWAARTERSVRIRPEAITASVLEVGVFIYFYQKPRNLITPSLLRLQGHSLYVVESGLCHRRS